MNTGNKSVNGSLKDYLNAKCRVGGEYGFFLLSISTGFNQKRKLVVRNERLNPLGGYANSIR